MLGNQILDMVIHNVITGAPEKDTDFDLITQNILTSFSNTKYEKETE